MRPPRVSDTPSTGPPRAWIRSAAVRLLRYRHDPSRRLSVSISVTGTTSKSKSIGGEQMTTFPQSHRDLLDAQFATLATVDREGLPQLTEVWFLHYDGELKLSLNSSRAKTKNLQERPACALLILDVANPYRYLEVRGRARLEADDDYTFADRVGEKYDADLRRHDGPGETRVVVTVEPVKVHAVDMSG
jgi:PPOX class probable F420-dependent enzyme